MLFVKTIEAESDHTRMERQSIQKVKKRRPHPCLLTHRQTGGKRKMTVKPLDQNPRSTFPTTTTPLCSVIVLLRGFLFHPSIVLENFQPLKKIGKN